MMTYTISNLIRFVHYCRVLFCICLHLFGNSESWFSVKRRFSFLHTDLKCASVSAFMSLKARVSGPFNKDDTLTMDTLRRQTHTHTLPPLSLFLSLTHTLSLSHTLLKTRRERERLCGKVCRTSLRKRWHLIMWSGGLVHSSKNFIKMGKMPF